MCVGPRANRGRHVPASALRHLDRRREDPSARRSSARSAAECRPSRHHHPRTPSVARQETADRHGLPVQPHLIHACRTAPMRSSRTTLRSSPWPTRCSRVSSRATSQRRRPAKGEAARNVPVGGSEKPRTGRCCICPRRRSRRMRRSPNLMVATSAACPGRRRAEIAEGNWNSRFPGTSRAGLSIDRAATKCGPYDCNLFVHSMGVPSMARARISRWKPANSSCSNTASVANDARRDVQSLNGDLITDPANRPTWMQNPPSASAVPRHCPNTCPNGHSAVKVPGRRWCSQPTRSMERIRIPSRAARGDGSGSSTCRIRHTRRSSASIGSRKISRRSAAR